ncbi:MAG: hypothetical protein HY089_07345 [Ignavibacteriales bacterium]|nr:hypothetical protein [Ignavibacteriales bacterium]
MRLKLRHNIVVLGFLVLVNSAIVVAALDIIKREITRTSEKEISATIDASFGTVVIEKGERDKIVIAEYRKNDEDKREFSMSYDISGERGNLHVDMKDTKGHRGAAASSIPWSEYKSKSHDNEDRHLTMQFTDAIPLSFNIELGAGRGDFDFSGLKVKSAKISSGASSVDFRCDQPNPVSCDYLTIESGVSKFYASNLSNVNFRRLKFSGGVGAYKLDFSGKLQQSANAEVEVGLGAVTMDIPRDIPTRIIYDPGLFSSCDIDEWFVKVRKGIYESDSYKESDTNLTIRIESGLGSVKVRSR